MIMPMLLSALLDDCSFDNAAAWLVMMTLEGGVEGDDDGRGGTAVLVMVALTNTLVATPFAARAV